MTKGQTTIVGRGIETVRTKGDDAGLLAQWYANMVFECYERLFATSGHRMPAKFRVGYGLVEGAGLALPKVNMLQRVQVVPREALSDGAVEMYFDRRFRPTESVEMLASTVCYAIGRALHASEETAHGEAFVETMKAAGFEPGPDERPSRVARPGATRAPVTWARPVPGPEARGALAAILKAAPTFPAGVVSAEKLFETRPRGVDESLTLYLPSETKLRIRVPKLARDWLTANAAGPELYFRDRRGRYHPLADKAVPAPIAAAA